MIGSLLIGTVFALAVVAADPPNTQAPGASDVDDSRKAPTNPVLRLQKRGTTRPEQADDDKDVADPTQKVPRPRPGAAPAEQPKPAGADLDRDLLKQLEPKREKEDGDPPLLRIGRNMRRIEDRLAQRDDSNETIDLQKQVLADLDELLKQCQNSGGSRSASRQQQKQQAKAAAQPNQQQPKPGSSARPSNQPAQAAGRGQPQREQLGKSDEQKDVWGHLSAMLRQEMSQYAKEHFLEKYRDLLEQYYATIAAQSRPSRSE
jgi:hypothetical protein